MADPTKFEPGFDYSAFEASNPTSPKPGAKLDDDFDNIALSLDETIDALGNVRRSDGKLNNHIVTKDSLAPDALALISGTGVPRGVWTPDTSYKVKDLVTHNTTVYIAVTSHVSDDDFDADLGDGNWMLFSADVVPPRVTPEEYGYTGNDLANDTAAFNAAVVAATDGVLALEQGASYTVGRIALTNSIVIEGNDAIMNLSGVGAGFYHDADYDYFDVRDITIAGDGDIDSEQYALVFKTSSIKVNRARIFNVHTFSCRQGIDTSGFVRCDTLNTQNDLMLGTAAGFGYGQVMGVGAGTLDPTHQHTYINVGGYRNGRHALYLGAFSNVTVLGLTAVEHAYGQTGQNHHVAISIARGAHAVIRGVKFIRCSDEGVAVDDDNVVAGHASDIDVEFVSIDPQNDFVAVRVGADGAVPGTDVGIDRVRIQGMLELNPANTVRDVQIFAVADLYMDLAINGAKNFTGGDRKVAVNLFGNSSTTYFENINIRLRGRMTGSSDIYAIGFYGAAGQADNASMLIENNVRGCKAMSYFDANAHVRHLIMTSDLTDTDGKRGKYVYSGEPNTNKASVFSVGRHGGWGAGFEAVSCLQDDFSSLPYTMGGLYFDAETSWNTASIASLGAGARLKIRSAGAMVDVMHAIAGSNLLDIKFFPILPTKTPSSAGDTGTAGQFAWDASYIYVCTATNTWKRVAIATW